LLPPTAVTTGATPADVSWRIARPVAPRDRPALW
jgi:hypothetical protein